MEPIRIMLVDDNQTFLSIATRFLQQTDGVEVVGAMSSAEESLRNAPALQPHVILMDLKMRGMSGLEAIPQMRLLLPEARIIALTLFGTPAYRQAALAAGADDFVSKRSLNADLLPAIRRAAAGPAAPPIIGGG